MSKPTAEERARLRELVTIWMRSTDGTLLEETAPKLLAVLDALDEAERERDFLSQQNSRLEELRNRIADALGDRHVPGDYTTPTLAGSVSALVADLAAERAAHAETRRVLAQPFPIMRDRNEACPRSVPWSVLVAHEAQARENHDQTLARLAERGGLSPQEAWCVAHDRRWRDRCSEEDAIAWVVSVGVDAVERDHWKARAEALETLVKYGAFPHPLACATHRFVFPRYACDCGLDAARKAAGL